MRTKEPRMRITRRVEGRPMRAECTACADATFQVEGWDPQPRSLQQPSFLRPDREHFEKMLRDQFQRHLQLAHQGKVEEDD